MIFDELGRFEQQCRPFTDAIDRALACSAPVLAVLKNESNPFLDSIRKREDCLLYTLYEGNRDELFFTVAQRLQMLIRDA
jgi:nucleoside-triphosphatase THEP1